MAPPACFNGRNRLAKAHINDELCHSHRHRPGVPSRWATGGLLGFRPPTLEKCHWHFLRVWLMKPTCPP